MECFTYDLFGAKYNTNFMGYVLDEKIPFCSHGPRPAVIICPGGGFMGQSIHEGEPVALAFAKEGYQAFILHYSTIFTKDHCNSVLEAALMDLAECIKQIKIHADEWNVDKKSIVLVGFSAGGQICACLSSLWNSKRVQEVISADSDDIKPAAVILGYSLLDFRIVDESLNLCTDLMRGIVQKILVREKISSLSEEELDPVRLINNNTCPTFLWHTCDDDMVLAQNSLSYALKLSQYRRTYELHVFEHGHHGAGLATAAGVVNKSEISFARSHWLPLALKWAEKYSNINY